MGVVPYNGLLLKVHEDLVFRGQDLNREYLRVLPAVQGQDPVSGTLFNRLLVIIVHLIHGLDLLILGRGLDHTLVHGCIPDIGAVLRIIRDALRQDITGPLDGFLRGFHALFLGNVGGSSLDQRLLHHLHAD